LVTDKYYGKSDSAGVLIKSNNNKNGTAPDIWLYVRKNRTNSFRSQRYYLCVYNDLLQYIMCIIIVFVYDNKTMCTVAFLNWKTLPRRCSLLVRHRFNTFPLEKMYIFIIIIIIILWECISSSVIQCRIYTHIGREYPCEHISFFYFIFCSTDARILYIFIIRACVCIFCLGFVLYIMWYNDEDSTYNIVYTYIILCIYGGCVPVRVEQKFFSPYSIYCNARMLHTNTAVVRFTDIVLRS